MELIKTPSFVAIDNMAELIFNQLKGKTEIDKIKTSVSSKLVKLGSKTFVEEYNKAIKSKDYSKFF